MLFYVPMNVAGEGLQTEELRLAPTALEHRTSAFVVSPEPSPLKNTEGPYLPGSSRGKSGHDKKTPLYLSLSSTLLTYEKEGTFIVPHHALVLSSLIQRNAPFSCLFKIRECNRGPALARIPLEDHNYYLWLIINYMYFVSECYSIATWFKSDPLIQSQSCLPCRSERITESNSNQSGIQLKTI